MAIKNTKERIFNSPLNLPLHKIMCLFQVTFYAFWRCPYLKKLVVYGAKKLQGEQIVQGSKNACLPIIVATILTKGENVLKRCPTLNDTINICKILTILGY